MPRDWQHGSRLAANLKTPTGNSAQYSPVSLCPITSISASSRSAIDKTVNGTTLTLEGYLFYNIVVFNYLRTL